MRFGVLLILIANLSAPLQSTFGADNDALIPADSNCRVFRDLAPDKVVAMVKVDGRNYVTGDVNNRLLSAFSGGKRAAQFLFDIYEGRDPEETWNKYSPYGLHYLTSDAARVDLTPDQVAQMKKNIRKLTENGEIPPFMLSRIVARIIDTEAKFLRENAERIAGLRSVVQRLEKEGRKLARQQEYRAEIEALELQNIRLEESILAKYAEYTDSPIDGAALGIHDIPEDDRSLAKAAYEAALHRAKRLGIPHREITIQPGENAIEFLADEGSDVGRLSKSVAAMTQKADAPFRMVFAPARVMRTRRHTGNMYLEDGTFGVSPQYLLFGKRDLLVTPMQMRALQLHLMQKAGNPTPFRGVVTQDASHVEDPKWVGLYGDILKGAYLRNFSKAFKGQSPELQEQMARGLHDLMVENRLMEVVGGVGLANRFASRSIEKLSQPEFTGIHAASYYPETLHIEIENEKTPGKLLGRIFIRKEYNGVFWMQLHSPYARFEMPLNAKDVKGPLGALLPLMKGTPDQAQVKLTQTDRENLIRILRSVQRTSDVSQNLSLSLDVQTENIRKAAQGFVEKPSETTEAALHDAISKYKEPKLDRLSLRGIEKHETKTPTAANPIPAVAGPKTPDHLLEALHTGRGMGTGSAPYRKAVEQISVSAVRTLMEQKGLDTHDRGPDLMGYDVLVAPRTPSSLRRLFVEVKGTSDINGMVSFTPAEVQFARNHFEKGDWVMAIVVVDKEGKTKVYFRRGIDLGNPLPSGVEKRPFLIHDLLSMGTEVDPIEVVEPAKLPAPSE